MNADRAVVTAARGREQLTNAECAEAATIFSETGNGSRPQKHNSQGIPGARQHLSTRPMTYGDYPEEVQRK